MDAVAYYLTLLIGVFALALTAYGLFNDVKNKTYPQTVDQLAFTVGIAVGGYALCVTALKALGLT